MTASDLFGGIVALCGLILCAWWFLSAGLVSAGAPKPSAKSLIIGGIGLFAGLLIIFLI